MNGVFTESVVRDDGNSRSVISSEARNLSYCLHRAELNLNMKPLDAGLLSLLLDKLPDEFG